MNRSPRTLVIPASHDAERESVASAWDGPVARLDRFWEPPALEVCEVCLYGPDTFCLVLAQIWGLSLLSPPDDLLLTAGPTLCGRTVQLLPLRGLESGPWPRFAKPLIPKQFAAGVYSSFEDLIVQCRGLALDMGVLTSPVVEIEAELRAFVLDQQVLTCSVYQGAAPEESPQRVLQQCCTQLPLPRTCVLDLAYLKGPGWVLLEANATWGAGLNGCEAQAVAQCLKFATTAP